MAEQTASLRAAHPVVHQHDDGRVGTREHVATVFVHPDPAALGHRRRRAAGRGVPVSACQRASADRGDEQAGVQPADRPAPTSRRFAARVPGAAAGRRHGEVRGVVRPYPQEQPLPGRGGGRVEQTSRAAVRRRRERGPLRVHHQHPGPLHAAASHCGSLRRWAARSSVRASGGTPGSCVRPARPARPSRRSRVTGASAASPARSARRRRAPPWPPAPAPGSAPPRGDVVHRGRGQPLSVLGEVVQPQPEPGVRARQPGEPGLGGDAELQGAQRVLPGLFQLRPVRRREAIGPARTPSPAARAR